MLRARIAALFFTILCLTNTAQSESVTLSWTAPGDDYYSGTATKYDLRYSTGMINRDNFYQATKVTGLPVPQKAGSKESVTISGLDAGRTYFFALRVADEANNWSQMSNIFSNARCDNPCVGIRGNVDADPNERVNIADFQYLIRFLFGIPRGPKPPCLLEANINGDPAGNISISDATYLSEYLFGVPNGPAPIACP